MTTLLELDQQFFSFINEGLRHPWLDAIMPLWREKVFWVPLYVALAAFLGWKFKREAVFLVLAAALTIGIADTVSSKVIKPSVKRDRPCRAEGLAPQVHLLVPCGGGHSFTSSHATNHFALATLLFLTLGRLYRRARYVLLLWAGSIAFGQVYVGVHYPLDVLVGGLLGALIGYGVAWAYLQRKGGIGNIG